MDTPRDFPGDIPARFQPRMESWDFERRVEMVQMRDGVALKTLILTPKGAAKAPVLLCRTPYDAAKVSARLNSPHLASVVPQMLDTAVDAGYIVAVQDVRGKYGSEGEYVMTRPPIGPLNPTAVDHATDAYDTVEWLVTNLARCNGRVGTIGGSYAGFTTVMSAMHPHPNLRAAVAFAPMVDGWIGDDFFHHGAFRQGMALDYIYQQEASRKGEEKWWSGFYDTYAEFLEAGSAGAVARAKGIEELGMWKTLCQHPAYDTWWQGQAVDRMFADERLTVSLMIVSGLFDQEDIYGGPALFKVLKSQESARERLLLVLGPWNHGGARADGRAVGRIEFQGDTGTWFRRHVMQPFLDHHLRDAPAPALSRVLLYETGADCWRRCDNWPPAELLRPMYLLADGRLGFDPPAEAEGFEEYVSDPAKPVPYRLRPIPRDDRDGWGQWLTEDQRNAAARPDVLSYQTPPLEAPLRIAGEPWADLIASTSGSDADWVVKLIDVWPDDYPARPEMGGYQQMISADIFRGRYREDVSSPQPLEPDTALRYRFRLPSVSHVFLRGHRIMVQIQSSWFPLYDRNPQTFVPNIFFAEPRDFVKATHRIYRGSAIAIPVAAE